MVAFAAGSVTSSAATGMTSVVATAMLWLRCAGAPRTLDQPEPRRAIFARQTERLCDHQVAAAGQRLARLDVGEHRDRIGGAAQRELGEPALLHLRRAAE